MLESFVTSHVNYETIEKSLNICLKMTLTLFHTRFSYHQIVALNRNEGNLLWFK